MTQPPAIDGISYGCEQCRLFIGPDDVVVQSVRLARSPRASGNVETVRRVGPWWHAKCWGSGVAGFEEIDRGRLSDVLARS